LQLLSLHYTNIWPFQEQTVIIRPRFGSYLIKAPIGSGKSFLFFDGPLFALYKKNARPLLNTNSSQGEVVCEFVDDGIQYCIQRTIKKTKTGESVASKFWMKPFVSWISQDEVVEYWAVSPFELPGGYTIAEFKNETDLQKHLDQLLPPKEVFLGTYFLLQDSDNIFELPPKDRLEIFKHVFWLLGIDESKDKIAEQKREISTIIKSRADVTQYDIKLQPLLDRLISSWSQLQTQWERYAQDTTATSHRSSFVSEQELLQGKIVIENLALPNRLDISPLRDAILSYQQRHTELQTTLRSYQTQYQSLQNTLSSLRQQLSTKTKLSDDIQTQLDRYNDSLFQEVTTQLQAKQDQRSEYIRSVVVVEEFMIIEELLKDTQSEELKKALLWNHERKSLIELRDIIQACIFFGKDAKYQLTAREDKKTSLIQRIQDLDTQIVQSTKTLAEFEQTITTNAQFHCNKIEWSCPYVEMINTATFKTLRNQLATMKADQERLQSQKTQLTNDLTTLSSDSMMKQLADDAEIAKKTLISSQRKLREEQITILTSIDKEINLLQSQRSQLQQQQAATLKLREQLITLQSEKTSLAQQSTETTATSTSLDIQIESLRVQIQDLVALSTIEEDIKILVEFEQVVDRLTILLQEFKDNQLLIKQLKEKEKILSDLYLVFSKELLLIVVQSNLPQIQDLMNMYLSQVVDYQLVMEIDKKSTSTESLELFVTIRDHLGERKVESLSWGQKVILKLIWMMAISVITRSQMLFLDETINNLDGDTVAKVAELLKNFIKGKGEQFQFYVVTHSHQIQDMGIWDGVIEVGKC
jgi:DNA repair exonuclease SbcCD ATPase subunit